MFQNLFEIINDSNILSFPGIQNYTVATQTTTEAECADKIGIVVTTVVFGSIMLVCIVADAAFIGHAYFSRLKNTMLYPKYKYMTGKKGRTPSNSVEPLL